MSVKDVLTAITIFESILNILSLLSELNTVTIFTALIMLMVVYYCSSR